MRNKKSNFNFDLFWDNLTRCVCLSILLIFFYFIFSTVADHDTEQSRLKLENEKLRQIEKQLKEDYQVLMEDKTNTIDTIISGMEIVKVDEQQNIVYLNTGGEVIQVKYMQEIKEQSKVKSKTKSVDNLVSEKEILCRIVEAEATGGTMDNKRNVAHVVLNRVSNKRFPNTIKKVVFQKRQFSPISDGRYYKVKITDSTRQAVEQALKGISKHNATYFMCRKGSDKNNVSWFDSKLNYLFKDGMHEFFN